MAKIHIAHVLHSFATGGLENGVVNIINNLPEGEYQHSIISVTKHDPEFLSRIKRDNVDVYDLNKPPGRSLGWLVQCWRLFRKLRPDICHTRNLGAIEAQVSALLAGVKYRIHGEHGWDVFDVGGTNVKYQKLRKIFKPFIHQFIALSIEAQDYLLQKVGVASSKVERICNGVDVAKFTPKAKSLVFENFPINEQDIVFGTVGRLAEIKNQTFLVDAFIELIKQCPESSEQLKLVIVGDGVLRPQLQERIDEHQLSENIFLAGQRSDIADCLSVFDVFVLPSLAEGISNTLLESMASGVPIIATDVGGNGDLVLAEHKESHLVKVNDITALVNSMKQYVENRSLIESDSALVRQHCTSNFSIETMVDKYHRVYQQSKVKGKQ